MKTERLPQEAWDVLLAIARKQADLLESVFDFAMHDVRAKEKRRGFLFGRSMRREREALHKELATLLYQMSGFVNVQSGVRWWQIPWEDMEKTLVDVLKSPEREGGWRFSSELKSFPLDTGAYGLVLLEEGAAQEFVADRIRHQETISPYSDVERQERMKRYDDVAHGCYLASELAFAASDAVAVRSAITDRLYSSVMEYYVQEGYWYDSIYRSAYEESMYAERYVEGVAARAVSRKRVRGAFAVGTYVVGVDGIVKGFQSLLYQPLTIEPREFESVLINRRPPNAALLKLAEALTNDDGIKEVPVSYIANLAGVAETADEFGLVVLQSALFTLLAKKLTLK